jgi:hypothetical protein
MKNLFFSLAFMLIGVVGFANTQSFVVEKKVAIENCKEKFIVKYNLGNVSNLTEAELNSMFNNLKLQNFNFNNEIDECTVSITAEINVGFGSVSVTVSYTSSNCEIALSKAIAAIKKAVLQITAAF